ncbi:RNA methyltransferase tRNA(m5U54)methyltransferase, partial [Oleoguttula sp. CCFEE 5521]
MAEQTTVSITAEPKSDQLVGNEGKTYRTIREGKAYILVPPKAWTGIDPKAAAKDSESQKVFYNPIQQFNRDLSVLAIRAFGRDLCERRRVKHEGSREKRVEKRN